MPAAVAHLVSMELVEVAMVVEMFLVARVGAVVSMAPVKAIVHMAVEVMRAVVPGAGADEHAIREPFRTVVAVGRALLRRVVIVAIRTNWLRADIHPERDLGRTGNRCAKSQGSRGKCWYKRIQLAHNVTSTGLEGQHDLSVVPPAPHPANIPQRYHQKGCLLRSLFGDGTKV